MGYLIISEYFDTASPKISQTQVIAPLLPFISFAEDKLYPMLSFRYGTQGFLKQPDLARFVTVEFYRMQMERDASGTVTTTNKYFKTVPCADLAAQGRLKSFQAPNKGQHENLMNGGVCVDPGDDDVTMGQKTDKDPFFQQILWRILPCTLPSGCATKEELSRVTYVSFIPKPLMDLSSKDDPISYVTLPDESILLGTGLSGRQTINLLKNEIIDDAGFLFGEKLVKSFTTIFSSSYSASDRNPSQLSCTQAEIDQRTCIPYWTQSFLTGPRKMIIKRQYKGMVETFSDLGGMVDMLFMIFFFPYSIYNSRVLKERLVEVLHGVKKPQKPSKKASIASLTAVSSINHPQSTNPSDDYRKRAENYRELLSSVESCFDLVKVSKEISSIWLVIQSNNLMLPDSIRSGIFNSLRQNPSGLNEREPPISIEEKEDAKQADFTSKSRITGAQPNLKRKISIPYHKKISLTNMNHNYLKFGPNNQKDVLDQKLEPEAAKQQKTPVTSNLPEMN
jgi:hypothetical protein